MGNSVAIGINETIGKRIKQLRKSRGISQRRLAHILGFKSHMSIYYIEKNAMRNGIKMEHLRNISNEFGIPISAIIDSDDEGCNKTIDGILEDNR